MHHISLMTFKKIIAQFFSLEPTYNTSKIFQDHALSAANKGFTTFKWGV